MARYIGPKCKLSGVAKARSSFSRAVCGRSTPSVTWKNRLGIQGERRRRLSDYGVQLREKQKMRRIYGVMEKQFRNYYKRRPRKRVRQVKICCGCSSSVSTMWFIAWVLRPLASEARQLVSHKAIEVNGKRSMYPLICSAGRLMSVLRNPANRSASRMHWDSPSSMAFPSGWKWMPRTCRAPLSVVPERADLPAEINEQLIVELYSK